MGALLAAAAFPDHAPLGLTGGFGEGTCATCHFGADLDAPGGTFAVDGVPERYTPGAEYALRVRIARPGMAAAGFQLSARYADGPAAGTGAGALEGSEGAAVRARGGVEYAGHSGAAHPGPGGEAAWTLRWRAPMEGGAVVFHAAGNAADGDGSPLGDHVYTARTVARPGER